MGDSRSAPGLASACVALLVLAACAAEGLSCGGDEPSPSGPSGRRIDDQVMHTPESSLPVVMLAPDGNWAHALVYDETIHDPITSWAGCLDLVMGCYRGARTPDGGAPDDEHVASCLRGVHTCPGTTGGETCCPQKCVDDFVAARASADGGIDDAVDQTFVAGEGCLDGLADARHPNDAGTVSP